MLSQSHMDLKSNKKEKKNALLTKVFLPLKNHVKM